MSQLPAGFVGKNTEIGAANKDAQNLGASNVSFTDLIDKGYWLFLGTATPTEPIEVKSINKYNIVQYPGVDDQQAQNLGNHYEPINIIGTLDFQDFERGVGNIIYSGDDVVDPFNYKSTVKKASEFKTFNAVNGTGGQEADQGDKTLIDKFFSLLLERQRLGRQFLLEAYIQDPFSNQEIVSNAADSAKMAKFSSQDKVLSVVQGYSKVSVYGVITEISFKLMKYGRWEYSIIFQPISPVQLLSERAAVKKKKSGFNEFKDFMEDTSNALDTYVNGTFNTIDGYYNQYIIGTLSEFKTLTNTFESIAGNALNLANLPAQFAGQVVSFASDVMTWAEKLTSQAYEIRNNYKDLGAGLKWTSQGANENSPMLQITDFVNKTATDNLNVGKSYAPKLESLKQKNINNSISLYSEQTNINNPTDINSSAMVEAVSQENINFISAKLAEKEADRLVRKAIAPLIMISKKIIQDQNGSYQSYQTYICKYNDSLRGLANKYYNDVNKWHIIAAYNSLDGDSLATGQIIKIPIL
jgi:hypothetical protein